MGRHHSVKRSRSANSAGNFDGWFYVAHDIGAAVPLSEYRRVSELSTARTLALLDLESNPPPAAVDRVAVAVDVAEGRVLQFGLLARALGVPLVSVSCAVPMDPEPGIPLPFLGRLV